MTFEEARTKLSLPDFPSPEEAKRAYHRLLRVHKPEANRDAFIALREAYECVCTTIAVRAHQSRSPATEIKPPSTEAAAPAPPPPPSTSRNSPPTSTTSTAIAPMDGDRFSKLLEQ